MLHRTEASKREREKKNAIAYTKQCNNVYVIHAHVYVYSVQFFVVVVSLLPSTVIVAKLNNTKLSWRTKGEKIVAATHSDVHSHSDFYSSLSHRKAA